MSREIPRFVPRGHRPPIGSQHLPMAEQWREPKLDWRQAPRRVGKLALLLFGYSVQTTMLLVIVGVVLFLGWIIFGGGSR